MIIIEPQRDELLVRINHKIKLVLLFVKRPNPWWLKGEGTHQAQTKFYLQQDIGSIYYIWHSGLYEHKDILFYPLQSNHFSLFFHCQSVYPPDDLKYLHSNSTKHSWYYIILSKCNILEIHLENWIMWFTLTEYTELLKQLIIIKL